MRRLYWEWPIAIYLFLGGMGGGMFFLTWLLLNIIFPGVAAVGSAMAFPVFLGLVWLAGGCFLLVFELGQPGVFLRVFFNSATSIIGHGARILSVCLIFGALWWVSYLPLGWFSAFFVVFRAFNITLAGIAGFCIMLYTGILLSSLKAHSFWASPALPVLFTVSALSTACACIILSCCVNPFAGPTPVVALAGLAVEELLHMVDIILIVAELTVLLVMVLSFLGAGNNTAHAVAVRWTRGKTAPWFWVGMVCIGLICPFCLNLAGWSTLASVLALCGGLLLRFLIVWSDERAEIPGENRYFNKVAKGDELFIHKWTRGENIY